MRSTKCEHVSMTQERVVIDASSLKTGPQGPRSDDVAAGSGELSTSSRGSIEPDLGFPWVNVRWRPGVPLVLPLRELLPGVEVPCGRPPGVRWEGDISIRRFDLGFQLAGRSEPDQEKESLVVTERMRITVWP
jgi:hypothetical protein